MTLSLHHRLALAGALGTSAVALADALTHGLTGYSPFSDTSDLTALVVLGLLVHGLGYAAFAMVLTREAWRFRSTNRVARGARWVVLGSLMVLAVGFLLVAPAIELRDAYEGTAYAVFGVVAGVGFAGLLGGSLVLGLALVRTGALGTGARVLVLLVPGFALTLLLTWLAPLWAHPAYVEAITYVGLALLGAGVAPPRTPNTPTATSSPTAAV
jgi:hypothetical protein